MTEHPEDLRIEAPGGEEVSVLPWPLLFRERVAQRVASSSRYRWWVLWTVLAGLFSVGFTITILSVSLPRIAEDLGTSKATLTWVLTGPLLAFGVVGPLLGKAGDLWGHRRIFLLGLAGSIVFAAASALAPNAGALITFRVLGVAEGAATGPASMALIMRVFGEGERVKAMGYWSLVGAGAPVLGVVAGGPIVEAFGWRWIFAAQVPFTLLALALAMLVLPREPGRAAVERTPLDVPGVVTLGVGITALLVAMNRGPEVGWSHPLVVAGFVLAPLSLLGFVAIERRAVAPLIPLEYFRRRNFSFPMGVQFFANFAYMGSFIIVPQFLQDAFGYGETKSGLLSIARPLSFSITAPLAGYVAVRVGERVAALVGTSAVVLSMLVWTGVSPGAGNLHVMAALALAGVGLGVAAPSMAAAVANAVSERDLGIAGAAQQLISQVGNVAGIQLAQTVQAARADGGAGLTASFHQSFFVLAVVCGVGVVCGAFVRPSVGGGAGARAGTAAHSHAAA